jgi:hypothetical protein
VPFNRLTSGGRDPREAVEGTSSDEGRGFRQRVDDFLTNYLRSTTTDQEILDFYGEGNIVGRKGIPKDDKALLDSVEASRSSLDSSLRPEVDRAKYSVGGIDQQINYDYTTRDMPGLVNPATGRPWQMTFGALPVDFGSSSLTPAANQFLQDFRVPRNAGNDYSFATGPNVQDRIDVETEQLMKDAAFYRRSPERLQEKLDAIKGKDAYIGDYSGQPMTPQTWKELGYIDEKPENFKNEVLKEFRDRIFEKQGAFGGVSTLTPVEQRAANNPQWRAALYETEGLAGPLSPQGFSSGYGGGSRDVQRFTTGSERLLPLQPYTEFFTRGDASRSSFKGSDPAPDFTPLQKTLGTRNYLIGRNILDGRGSLGAPVRVTQAGVNAAVDLSRTPSVQAGAKGLLVDSLVRVGMGQPLDEAVVDAVADPISAENFGGAPTASLERLGPNGEFVDTRSNTVLSPKGEYTNTGIAYRNGKPVIVPRGSVAGEGNVLTQASQALSQAGETWNRRAKSVRKAGSKGVQNELQYVINSLRNLRLPYFGR